MIQYSALVQPWETYGYDGSVSSVETEGYVLMKV